METDRPPLRLLVAEAPRGRETGWGVACEEHGAMPVLAPSKRAGITAATTHADDQHRLEKNAGKVRITVRPRARARASHRRR